MRVFLDTNVLASALRFKGKESVLYLGLSDSEATTLLLSEAVLEEPRDVLANKFGWIESDVSLALGRARQAARLLPRRGTYIEVGDEQILKDATAARADLFVTGDRRLLHLRQFGGVPIVRPADALRTLGWATTGPSP